MGLATSLASKAKEKGEDGTAIRRKPMEREKIVGGEKKKMIKQASIKTQLIAAVIIIGAFLFLNSNASDSEATNETQSIGDTPVSNMGTQDWSYVPQNPDKSQSNPYTQQKESSSSEPAAILSDRGMFILCCTLLGSFGLGIFALFVRGVLQKRDFM